jgi:sortase B
MKKRASGLETCAKIARFADWVLDKIIAIILIVALLYSGYDLWDTWQIYNGAGVSNELLKYKPDPSEGSNPSLSELQKINPDVCAWVTVDGTSIDYPVVQGKDNLEYVNKTVEGGFALSGSLFLDYRNTRDFSDFYSLIYGHHMEGNVMFGEIPEFQDETYFKEHTTGTLCLPDKSFQIEWFACVHTDAYDSNVFNPLGYENESTRDSLLEYIQEKSVQYRDIGVTASDQIISLATCFGDTTDGRMLLFGRISEEK